MIKRNRCLTGYPVKDEKDLARLKAFLKENDLPFNDLRLDGNDYFLYLDGDTLAGCGGLEYYGDYCLLRSVAVARPYRGEGYGKEIVADLISAAKNKHLWSISLLTETAQSFFEKFGFKEQSRADAPMEIQTSSEFSSVCPVSAVLMSLKTK